MTARRVAGSMLVAGLLSGVTGAAEDASYDCQLLLLKTPSEQPRFEAGQVSMGSGVLVASGVFSVTWGDSTLANDGTTLRWNGVEIAVPLLGETPAAGSSVKILGTPRITVALDMSAQVKAGGGEPVQYFEREADGRFALRQLAVAPELDLSFTLAKAKTPDVLRVSWRYHLVRVGRRKALPGVSLDVGAPEIRDFSGQHAGDVKLGQWCLMAFGESRLVLFFKILPQR